MPGLGAVGAELLGAVEVEAHRLAADRDEVIEAVAAVDVQALADRAESVSRVEVAVSPDRVLRPPEGLAGAAELDAAEVVEVPGLGVEDLAEKAFFHQVEAEHFRAVVAAVLHHNAVAFHFLGRLHERPAVVDGVGGGDLGGGVLARFQGLQADRDVPFPGSGREDEVEVITPAEPLEIPVAPGIAFGLGASGLDTPLLDAGYLFLDDIADGLDFDALDLHEVPHVGRAHAPDSDKPDPDRVDRRDIEFDQGVACSGCGASAIRIMACRPSWFCQGRSYSGRRSHLQEIPAPQSFFCCPVHISSQ